MNKRLIADIAERAFWTYVQAFATLLIASGIAVDGFVDLSLVAKAAVAAIAPVLSVVKGVAASQVGAKGTASSLPAHLDTTVVGS